MIGEIENSSIIRFVQNEKIITDFYFFHLVSTDMNLEDKLLTFTFSNATVCVTGKRLENILYDYMDKNKGVLISDKPGQGDTTEIRTINIQYPESPDIDS